MAKSEQKTFHCELIDPTGKLLDCDATLMILPAHDGQIGILPDHMPMLCQLGLGTMKVVPAPGSPCVGVSPRAPEAGVPSELFFFIDGGSALVAQNTVTVIAYDALALESVQMEQIESLIASTARDIDRQDLSAEQRAHQNERLRALQKLAESRQNA